MEPTRFTNLHAEEVSAEKFNGDLSGALKGAIIGKTTISKNADYSLTAKEAAAAVIGITLTAASKTVTLGLATGQMAFVINEGGVNSFTLKNTSGDSGTSLAAGKVALVIGSSTANATQIYVLNETAASNG